MHGIAYSPIPISDGDWLARMMRRCTSYRRIPYIIIAIFVFCNFVTTNAQQQQDPTTMNGGSVLAMAGDGCVALAVDKRFGSGPQMVNIAPRHVLMPHPRLMVAFTGLEGDIQSLSQELSIEVARKHNRALGFMSNTGRKRAAISPKAMATMISHVLYGRRRAPYYVEPLLVGLEETTAATTTGMQYRPFLCSYDLIGAQSRSRAFCVAGVAGKSLYGTAEALWRPGLSSEELAQVCGKAFLSALERDCLSGYGAIIYLITPDGVQEYDLACRND